MSIDYKLVKDTFGKALPIANDVVIKTLGVLFSEFPQAKAIFEGYELDTKQQEFTHALSTIVKDLGNPAALEEFLYPLGARHLELGIKPDVYPWFSESLIRSLAYFFGDDWSDSMEAAWRQSAEEVCSLLVAGGQKQIPTPKPMAVNVDESEISTTNKAESLLDKINAVNSQRKLLVEEQDVVVPVVGDVDLAPLPQIGQEYVDTETDSEVAFSLENKVEPEATREEHEVGLPSVDHKNIKPDIAAITQSVLDAKRLEVQSIKLPEALRAKIQQAAESMVREAVEHELEKAMEDEVKRYVDGGISDMLKQSA